MRFNVLPCPEDIHEEQPVVDMTIQVVDGCAYLCARPSGSGGWLYLLKLSEEGVSFFSSVGSSLGFPVEKDGRLKVYDKTFTAIPDRPL